MGGSRAAPPHRSEKSHAAVENSAGELAHSRGGFIEKQKPPAYFCALACQRLEPILGPRTRLPRQPSGNAPSWTSFAECATSARTWTCSATAREALGRRAWSRNKTPADRSSPSSLSRFSLESCSVFRVCLLKERHKYSKELARLHTNARVFELARDKNRPQAARARRLSLASLSLNTEKRPKKLTKRPTRPKTTALDKRRPSKMRIGNSERLSRRSRDTRASAHACGPQVREDFSRSHVSGFSRGTRGDFSRSDHLSFVDQADGRSSSRGPRT